MLPVNVTLQALVTALVLVLSVAPASYSGELDYGPASRSGAAPAIICTQPNTGVREYADLITRTRKHQPDLAEALRLFPKGADIHNHLSGSISPEQYIAMGIADGDCYGPDSSTPNSYTLATATPSGACSSGFKPLANADQADRTRIIRSLSLFQFDYPDIQQGHDQFFATFGRFNAVSGAACNTAPMLAALLQKAHTDSVSYVETMLSFQSQAVSTLARLLGKKFPGADAYRDSANYPDMMNFLLSVGLNDAVAGAQQEISRHVSKTNALLKCGSEQKDAACAVSFAFLAAVNRNASQKDGVPDLAKIFTQTAFSILLAATDSRVVGVNLLSGEDAAVSMGSFDTQMKIFGYFHTAFPAVNIALHAGELTPCFVAADTSSLKDHLTGSLKAGAKRIGHGVSFAFLKDHDKAEVARLFNANGALVEIMFTSNAQILGVAGDAHPFTQYAAYDVPMAFSTDDQGVSYASYTDEWLYGFMKYNLDWKDLQHLGRNSLQHSFIPGAPLWTDLRRNKVAEPCAGQSPGSPNPSDLCQSFLDANAKAKAQWDYENRLTGYWQTYGKKFGPYLKRY